MALAIADSREFRGKKTEAAGLLPPPPNNGDKKKGNCLELRLRGATAAQEARRTDRDDQANDWEERAHFRNGSQATDQRSFFEAAVAGIRVGVTPALIHVNVVVRLGAGEEGDRDVDVDIPAAAAGVLIIIYHLVSTEIVAEKAGVLETKVPEGQEVKIGEVVATIYDSVAAGGEAGSGK